MKINVLTQLREVIEAALPGQTNLRKSLAHLQSSVGDYPKSVQSLNMKKGKSDTPLS